MNVVASIADPPPYPWSNGVVSPTALTNDGLGIAWYSTIPHYESTFAVFDKRERHISLPLIYVALEVRSKAHTVPR
mgnify:CR=1 FL=1